MKHPYAPGHPYMSGETVTPGRFICDQCGHEYAVAEPKVTNLPVCPVCQNDTWTAARKLFGLRTGE